jgi:hypothetical protein
MVDTFKSPETFFAILGTVKILKQKINELNEEILNEFGPEPEQQFDYKYSWLSQHKTTMIAQLFYWEEELKEQINIH